MDRVFASIDVLSSTFERILAANNTPKASLSSQPMNLDPFSPHNSPRND